MATYCEVTDLLVGDTTIADPIPERFIQAATDEINAELGFEYVVPIDVSDGASTAEYIKLTLKRCCALIASGRIIMSQATPGESGEVHGYGNSLLREGHDILRNILNGTMDLIGVSKANPGSGNAPATLVADEISPLDAFYGTTGTPSGYVWGPGKTP